MDKQFLTIDSKTMEKTIPPQMELGASAEALSTGASGVQGASNAAVIGNFVLNVVLSGAMNLLWGLVNSLQIIVVIPLL